MKKKFIAKLVLTGDPAVGKTSLKTYLTDKVFKTDSPMTLGADITRVVMDVGEDYQVVLQIWDIAGQTKFMDVNKAYYNGAKGVIVVFDVTREETFMDIPKWIERVKTSVENDIPILMVANKMDLTEQIAVDKKRAVEYSAILSNWLGMQVPVAFTSAKTGENVEDAFFTIASNMLRLALER